MPQFLNLGARWGQVVSVTPQLLWDGHLIHMIQTLLVSMAGQEHLKV
jgi:hypothetical protein